MISASFYVFVKYLTVIIVYRKLCSQNLFSTKFANSVNEKDAVSAYLANGALLSLATHQLSGRFPLCASWTDLL